MTLTHTARDTARYAWIIDRDCLASSSRDEAGTIGPLNVDPQLVARLKAGEGHSFDMYDDDGQRYYRGRLVTTGDRSPGDYCDRPLRDYGTPNAGAVSIRWQAHREWNV